MSRFQPLTVAAVERLTDDAVAVTFAERLPFVQGQHLTVRVVLDGVEVRRSYSICSPAGGALRIGVKRLPGGAFSEWANAELRPGDVVEAMPPLGRFTTPLYPEKSRHHLAIAAGSGITPVISLLATTLEREPHSRFTLVYGNRTAREVMFAEELADLKDLHGPRLNLLHVLSQEPVEAPIASGRIDEAKLRTLLPLAGPADEYYLCGPMGLVETARKLLTGKRVHYELFYAGEPVSRPHATPEGAVFDFTLDGRTTRVALRGDESLLGAALRVRSDAPYACRGGVCGTCRVRVTSGEVAMDQNYALEPEELSAGYALACQSRPVTPAVCADFDA
ncbi:2Fe-2S iron-sulfur cluster-binding protein [Nonomuraea sp. NBC_01738]|uniref:2Fe-2S iron-sulfur cluster-binding protein n=1 Tax=Nonomuraea sp. NBC_01738 TaxID=2976003 RepID=UPI002E15CB00|nr:2Fe-2S iron-sulfur cluster-binding protein [Nonomuraea sp. NBC_01738]